NRPNSRPVPFLRGQHLARTHRLEASATSEQKRNRNRWGRACHPPNETVDKESPSPAGRRWRAARRSRVGEIMTSIGGDSRIPHPPRDFRDKSHSALSRFAPAAEPWTRERDRDRQSRTMRGFLPRHLSNQADATRPRARSVRLAALPFGFAQGFGSNQS